jgi:hypothetical protein
VDDVPIPWTVFRAQLEADRGGGAALAYLRSWVLPAVAAWTSDRSILVRAIHDENLVSRAAAMRRSDAQFLDCLLGAELDAEWLVILVREARAFDVKVDGIVRNWDLHALLADALRTHGVSVRETAPAALDALRTSHAAPKGAFVRGTWDMYTFRAASSDLTNVPHDFWVWGEGSPRDVPPFNGKKTLLLGPATVARTWSAGRVFSKLLANVHVARERSDAPALLASMT